MNKLEKTNFKVQRNCAKTGIISSSVLFVSSASYEIQFFFDISK